MDLSTEMEDIRQDEYNFIKEYSLKELKKWNYCSGTMFLGKPRFQKPIKDLKLDATFFEGETKKQECGTTQQLRQSEYQDIIQK